MNKSTQQLLSIYSNPCSSGLILEVSSGWPKFGANLWMHFPKKINIPIETLAPRDWQTKYSLLLLLCLLQSLLHHVCMRVHIYWYIISCTYIFVCVCICISAYVYIYIYICIDVRSVPCCCCYVLNKVCCNRYMRVCVHIYLCIFVCTYLSIFVYVCMCTRAYMYAYI